MHATDKHSTIWRSGMIYPPRLLSCNIPKGKGEKRSPIEYLQDIKKGCCRSQKKARARNKADQQIRFYAFRPLVVYSLRRRGGCWRKYVPHAASEDDVNICRPQRESNVGQGNGEGRDLAHQQHGNLRPPPFPMEGEWKLNRRFSIEPVFIDVPWVACGMAWTEHAGSDPAAIAGKMFGTNFFLASGPRWPLATSNSYQETISAPSYGTRPLSNEKLDCPRRNVS